METTASLRLVGDVAVPDGRRRRGERSRRALLERAVQLASTYGLEGMTLGALARDVGVAKSNLQVHFATKLELQLATLDLARETLINLVVAPTLSEPPGERRLRATGSSWFGYLGGDAFDGGCFLCSASAEMDGRPGPVRDAVEATMREWLAWLEANIAVAMTNGEFCRDINVPAAAFRLNALGMAANWQRQLLGDLAAVNCAREAWDRELDSLRAASQEGVTR